MPLEIDSRVVGEVLVVKCKGRIVSGSEAPALQDHVKNAVKETPDVVLDLGEVAFIDSSGLGTLVRLMTHARSRGGDVKLCAIPDIILKSLKMTHLTTVFETHAGQGEAITATYQRRQPVQKETSPPSCRIVCLEKSADVLAYLRELLRHAGYSVLTATMLPDAQLLIKATRPSLVIMGPQMARVRDKDAQEWIRQTAPGVPLLILDEGFSTGEAGEAGSSLVDKIRQLLRAS